MRRKIGIGWEEVFKIYPKRNIIKSARVPLLISFFLTMIPLIWGSDDITTFIIIISDNIISILPSSLGFVLTGYTLLMGLGSNSVMKGLVTSKNEHTLFQKLNATFAIVIFSMISTLLLGVTFGYICKHKFEWIFDNNGYIFYNYFSLWVILFSLLYTIVSIIDVVINIFNFGQYTQGMMDKIYGKEDITGQGKH